MFRKSLAVCAIVGTVLAPAHGQVPPAGPSGTKTLAATLDVYAFPTVGQAPETQSQDEAACYQWAVQNVGTDPFALSKTAEQDEQRAAAAQEQAKSAGKGSGAKGAVGGAAAGALIGAIADDAGKGAVIGGSVGLIGGRMRGRRVEDEAAKQAEMQGAQAQQITAAQLDNFKKAFSVCLEGKKYMVKY